MKNYIYLIAFATVVGLLFSSCKNDEPGKTEDIALYSQFKVGNYWIYQDYSIDSLGTESGFGRIDSIYISKDTLINNVQYFVFVGGFYGNSLYPRYQRDSLGYIVNEKGTKLFSTSNFTDYIFSDIYRTQDSKAMILSRMDWKMSPIKTTVTVPAGEFEVLVNHGYVTAYYYDKSDVLTDSIKADQYNYYAANVGQVKRVFHYYSQFKEKSRKDLRLVRYKVN